MPVNINTSVQFTDYSSNPGYGYPVGQSAPVRDANSLIYKASDLMNTAVWFLISLAVIWIVWHGFLFVKGAASEDDRKKYSQAIMWGVVGLFLILSLWGLVAILGNTFGTGNFENGQQSARDFQSLMLQGQPGR